MSDTTRTLSNGTTIRIEPSKFGPLVILDHTDAPADMRNLQGGRVIGGAFQPSPFAEFGINPETLRAIADLIEEMAK